MILSSSNKLKILVTSKYLELILLLFRQIVEENRKPTDFACPVLFTKKQLWDIPERREPFNSRSAEVINHIRTARGNEIKWRMILAVVNAIYAIA